MVSKEETGRKESSLPSFQKSKNVREGENKMNLGGERKRGLKGGIKHALIWPLKKGENERGENPVRGLRIKTCKHLQKKKRGGKIGEEENLQEGGADNFQA